MEKYLALQMGFLNVIVGVILFMLYIKSYGILDQQSYIVTGFIEIATLILTTIYFIFSLALMKKAKSPKLEDVLSGKIHQEK